jgi:hypothetical protein
MRKIDSIKAQPGEVRAPVISPSAADRNPNFTK